MGEGMEHSRLSETRAGALCGFGGAQNLGRIMAQILVGTLEEGTDAASHLWEGIFLAVPLKTFNDLWPLLWFCFLAK